MWLAQYRNLLEEIKYIYVYLLVQSLTMAETKYSRAFLVGGFSGKLKPKQLENNQEWKRITISEQNYNDLCSMFYQSHIDAMVETSRKNWFQRIMLKDRKGYYKPSFLQDIRHYQYNVEGDEGTIDLCTTEFKQHNEIIVKPFVDYKMSIRSLHVYFFPLDIILFALEIDDSESSVNTNYTEAHQLLRTWAWMGSKQFSNSTKRQFGKVLAPLIELLPDHSLKNLISEGNKLKLYQIIHFTDVELFNDKTLYELATCSPIGVVGSNNYMAPSQDYYDSILKSNRISIFDNWKGLALFDSFTVVGFGKDFNVWPFSNLYFQYAYLRSIFEKEFCFSRNNAYRLNKVKGDLLTEIALMEKYYFYDNISHNFLPNLLYQTMAKGLCIKEERELLARQIKEKEESKSNRLLAFVSVFAVFSIAFDLYSILKAWLHNNIHWKDILIVDWDAMSSLNKPEEMPLLAFVLTLLAFAVSSWFVKLIFKHRKR